MCNTSCNDYSLITAKTGITNISIANNNLDGTGAMNPVFIAGKKGATINSIIIKATQPVLVGMVRLYILGSIPGTPILFKEIQIPTNPIAPNVPVPTPQYLMFETSIVGQYKLASGYSILASTQNADSFNIIIEALDWDYPAVLPNSCCNYKQVTGNSGVGIISIANTNLDGSGSITALYTVGPYNGATIRTITIKALQNTHNGMVRFFLSKDGVSWNLMREVLVPETIQSGYQPSWKHTIEMNYCLEQGCMIGASTQLAESFGVSIEGEEWNYPI